MSRNRSSTLFCQEWTVQKAGLTLDQNEDACLIRSLGQEDDPQQILIAISDGATEAVYSRLWAMKLVEAAGPDWPSISDDELGERLKQVSKAFSPMEPGKEIPWFVRNKYMDQGSQATLLVATVTSAKDTDAFAVRAVSVGDCCLFLFKASGEVSSFPVQHSDEFGVNPVLLGNRLAKPAKYDHWEGLVESGDLVLIGTDAVSKWALQCLERNQSGLLFDALLGLLNQPTSDVSPSVERSSLADSPPSAPAAKTHENHSHQLPDAEKPSTLRGLLRHLWPWSTPEPHATAESSDDQQSMPEDTANQPSDDGEYVTSQNAQPAAEEATAVSRSQFEQFIQRYRAPESALQMRNDDSTLIICMPVRNPSAGQVIRELQAAVTQRLQASPRMNEVSSD